MNKKEWDAMTNAVKNNKRIADTYKTILPETSSSENGVSSFLKKMQPNMDTEKHQTIANMSRTAKPNIPELASDNVTSHLKGSDIGFTSELAKKMAKMNLDQTTLAMYRKEQESVSSLKGVQPLRASEMPQSMIKILNSTNAGIPKHEMGKAFLGANSSGMFNSKIANALSITKASRSDILIESIAALKDVQPSLVERTNLAIINWAKGVNTRALTDSGEATAQAFIDPNLTKMTFKTVSDLLKGINPDASSFFEGVANISQIVQPSITADTLRRTSCILKEIARESDDVFNSATSETTETVETDKQNFSDTTRIQIYEMAYILNSLDENQEFITGLCGITSDETMDNMEVTNEEKEQEPQPSNKPLFKVDELNESIDECVNDKESFQRRVRKWSPEQKKQFTNFMTAARLIINFFIELFIMPYLQEYVGLPITTKVISMIKELPEKESKKIGTLQTGEEAIIIDNTEYYFKIVFTDENGEVKEGYIAKRNVIVMEDETEKTKIKEE